MIRFKPAAIAAVTCLVATAASAWAQGDEAEGPGAISTVTIEPQAATLRPKLRSQNLGREEGLPQNNITSIAQDRTGFMWLGTQDGVARYDGQRFVVFRHVSEQPASLSSSFINEVLVAKDGTLWVGTQEGLNRLDRESSTFERFVASDKPGSLSAPIILALEEGPDGRLWIGTAGGGVNVLDPATGKFRAYSVEDGINAVVPAIHVDADGTAWVGTGQGVFRFAAGKDTPEQMFGDNEKLATAVITALTRDRSGNLWIGTEGAGLARHAPDTKKVQLYKADPANWERLHSDDVTAVFEDESGQIWVGTAGAPGALQTLDPASGAFDRHLADPDDPRALPDAPTTLFQDAAGVIWVGTERAGVALIDAGSRSFKAYKIPTGVAGLSQKGQDLWFSTIDGSLCRWRGKNVFDGTCYKMEQARLTAVLVDSKGTVWAGSMGQGLYRLDAGSTSRWTLYLHDPSDPRTIAPAITSRFYEDRSANLWIAHLGDHPQRFDRAKQEFVSIPIDSMGVYMIEQDPKEDNVFWFGTVDKGLVSVDLDTGSVQSFTPSADANNQSDNAVVDFLFDGDHTIWLATYGGGLKKLDRKTGKFKEYRRQHGMPSDTLYSVLQDNAGKLWLSSIAGIARFDPKTEETHIFTASDGLQSNELTINAAARFDDGRIVFGGLKGITVFQPLEVDIDRYSPPPVVTAIDVLGEPYSQDRSAESIREVSLDHDEATLTVQFAALSFSGSDRLQFEYKVEGASDRWLRTDSSEVSLAGLDDGDYNLLLRARNRHGVESEPIAVAIVVAPPPWRTWWAYATYGATLLGILFGIYRYQQARIDRLQKLARLATVEKEFEITAAVQAWFLPEATRFSNGDCDLIGFYRGAEKCSGDWWWYEDLGEGRLWVIVADVTGHGAGPAMVTAAVAMGLSVQADSSETVIQRLERVNREVLIRCKGKATMTMTAVVIDQNSGELVLYGVGGLPALVMVPDGKHLVLSASGTPLGSSPRLEVGEKTAHLGPGDRLIITTDGIIETAMANGRPFGFRRFVNVMRDVRGMPLEQAVERIVRDVDLARSNQPQDDDFTFCVLERHG